MRPSLFARPRFRAEDRSSGRSQKTQRSFLSTRVLYFVAPGCWKNARISAAASGPLDDRHSLLSRFISLAESNGRPFFRCPAKKMALEQSREDRLASSNKPRSALFYSRQRRKTPTPLRPPRIKRPRLMMRAYNKTISDCFFV